MCEIEYQPKAVVPDEVRNCVDKKSPFLWEINVDFRGKSSIIVNKMIGDRIKQARLAKGATLEEVAQLLTDRDAPITKAGLSKYEKNKSIPSQTFMIQLANVLSVKPSFFVAEPEFVTIWHAFRKQSKLPKKLQEHVKASAEQTIESQLWLMSVLHPEPPTFPKKFPIEKIEDVESAAEGLRKKWRLGHQTIGCLVEMAESFGVIVVPHVGLERQRQFDGLSGFVNQRYPVAVVSTSVPDDRIRYTLAHELGHLSMDCGDASEKEEEGFANRFASAFIVPEPVMRRELGPSRRNVALREFAVLKQKHGLSMQGLIRRAFDLDIISQGHYTSLFKQFSSRGWRKKEPVDFVSGETPKRFLQMVLRAVAEGIISEKKAEQMLPGSTAKIKTTGNRLSASELRRLPSEERSQILREAAASACDDYSTESELLDFEAMSEDDLYA